MRALYAWGSEGLIGRFTEDDSGTVSFEYLSHDLRLPISLSLPLSGGWDKDVPRRFLEGLLPEDGNTKLRMRLALDAPSEDPFDLLDATDAAGGLCFTSSPDDPRPKGEVVLPAGLEDILVRIDEIEHRSKDVWWPEDGARARFSLAGSQGKFTLSRFCSDWYWPSASLPSTHIFKPEMRSARGSVDVECASMSLAGDCGLVVPAHWVFEAEGRKSYVVERFDRSLGDDGVAVRLRVEDLAQALGADPKDKYDVELSEVIALLVETDPSKELCYQWLAQVMFNASACNCDAHAKNYGVMLDGPRVRLTPMYDVVVTEAWGKFDPGLAMPLHEEGIYFAEWLRPSDWESFARRCSLDAGRVSQMARTVAGLVLEHAAERLRHLPAQLRDRAIRSIESANRRIEPLFGVGLDALVSFDGVSQDGSRVPEGQEAKRSGALPRTAGELLESADRTQAPASEGQRVGRTLRRRRLF